MQSSEMEIDLTNGKPLKAEKDFLWKSKKIPMKPLPTLSVKPTRYQEENSFFHKVEGADR